MTGIGLAIDLVCAPGAPVVVSPPVYRPFFGVVEDTGRTISHAPLGADGRLDLDVIDSALTAAGPGSAYLLCNPQNPTGTVPTADELDALTQIADRRGARVIADEIHAPLVAEGFVPYLSRPGTERAFVATSASKSFNLAGVKAGLLIAGSEAQADLDRLPWLAEYGVSQWGLVAHLAALRDGGAWLDTLVADLEDNRRILRELLDARLPEVRWNGERGCYLAWLEFPERLGDDPAALLLSEGRVALNSGVEFGPGGEHRARLNYATTPQILEQAIERIARVL